ncbi:MAG: hypothetical protein HY858_00670 [Candidatus Solibacter usitatus]|nr:hypothetical protein [Candidatus Solibacter usitatus]
MTRMNYIAGPVALALALAVSGCSTKAPSAEQQVAEAQKQLEEAQKKLKGLEEKRARRAEEEPAAAAREFSLAAGAPVQVRTISSISTKAARVGDKFEATLAKALEVDGYVIAAQGATVRGEVTECDPGGRVKGVASLAVAITSIAGSHGQALAIRTQPVGVTAKSTKKKDAAKIGIGAGIGAAIGAIAGGGKGAAIGAGVGGGAGTGVVLATKGDAAVLPSESLLTFKLAEPLTVTEKR